MVRNSPLDILVTVLKGGASTIRTSSRFTVGTGMTFALCYELDEILISEGKEPFFVPKAREIIREVGLENQLKNFLNRLGIKDKVEPSVLDTYTNNVSDEDKAAFESSTQIKWEDYIKAHKTAMEIRKGSNPSSVSVSSLFDKDDPFKRK